MKLQSNSCLFFVVLLLSMSVVLLSPHSQAHAQANKGDLASAGLVVHWESNIGGAPLANGSQSFVLWSHTTEKREYVTVRSGGRIIERIRGEEVDLKKLEEAVIQGEKLLKSPRLGLEGAKKKAEKLVATYKTLGRKVEVEPYSQQLIYAVSLTTNGIVSTMDAETGAVIWKTEVGRSTLAMFGPGVSDDYVAVTNGNTLYVYELVTGNIVTTRKLMFTPTASPIVLLGKAIVPSVDGRLVAYDIKSEVIPPGILRTGTENRLGLTISADHQFLSWPTGIRLVMARMEKTPILWAAANVGEPILSLPIATQNGFLASSIYGTVFHASTNRDEPLIWKSRLAVQVSQSPLANKDMAFIVSDEGLLFALNLADGSDAWGHQNGNIAHMISVGKQNIYVMDSRKALVAIDLAKGFESRPTNLILPDIIPNAINDRLLFVTKQGQVTCLREIDANAPTFTTVFTGDISAPPNQTTKPEPTPTKPIEEDTNVFGGAGEPVGDSPNPFGGTDPF